MLNREIFVNDPVSSRLANNGVAQVKDDLSKGALDTLEYELRTFVCDGAYAKGMDSILSNYLSAFKTNNEQPGVWISGFFGSGKSHLAKMLRTLWTNQTLNNGSNARSTADLPEHIVKHFDELSSIAAGNGGLYAASGTLGAGAGNKVRMAFLGIIFKSAGLPEQYHLARFVMWLKAEGVFEQVKSFVEAKAKVKEGVDPWTKELKNLHVSPIMHDAVLQAIPGIGADMKEVREMLRAQYKIIDDVTNDEMVSAIVDAISNDGELPLTLVVLDEVQQYIGDNVQKAFDVQEVVETCSGASALKSKLLFVATGQSALSGMANLQRLMGRFQVPVQLEDTDVDAVIRKVILQKKPSAESAVRTVVDDNLGEISRHLRGSTIEHNKDDEQWMVPDYPLLPVRRRFWERILPALDRTGTGSQLRNQLRVVHEALKTTADKELGYVVPADFLYDQISTNLLQTGVISKEIYETISRKRGGDEDSQLQGRLLSLILLISKLPAEMEYGIHATVDTLSDLLLEDLHNDKHKLRPLVPKMLQQLEDEHEIMSRETGQGREFSLQTVESQAWYDEFRRQENDLMGNPQTLEAYRSKEIQRYITKQVAQARIVQGEVKEPRAINPSFDSELPTEATKRIYAWAPEQTEKQFNDLSRGADPDSATIYVYVPTIHRSELKNAIVALKAAENTLEVRGRATTEAGKDALQAMETRLSEAERAKKGFLNEIFSQIQVRLAGGQEVEGDTLAEQMQNAGALACQRLYNKFKMADSRGWAKVYNQASQLADPNALEAVDFNGEAHQQPVCAEVYRYIGAMKTGKDIRDNFKDAPYGWGNDVVDGALYAMLAAGVLRASDVQERPIDAKSLDRSSVTQTKFRPENVTLSKVQLIKVRGVVSTLLEEACNTGEEATKLPLAIINAKNVARSAGGDAPLPMAPSTALLSELEMHSGNQQLQKAFDSKEQLIGDFQQWKDQTHKAELRMKLWKKLTQAMEYCYPLAIYKELQQEQQAIITNRSLLSDPCPVKPLLDKATNELRTSLTAHRERYEEEHRACMSDLLADENWQKLDEAKRNEFLKKRNLDNIPSINIADEDSVFNSLDETSFNRWNDKVALLPGIFDAVLKDAISALQPKTKYHKLNKPLLENENDLQKWLVTIEQELRAELEKGPVVPQ
ncbi:BREX system P-loop protein BrxC [Aliivibrio fischeri]|uniref:BREX system P-loop protein BrxC n=1 Tax=Aliivibrio fischeri TaxID=668 RepID=UPI0018F1AF60|nr:BREX system P-loop protein BrxC [Aliivibrio fischeri]USR94437.1 BREX system P-loop protein BrxC [Aliivibrio fischeri ATCC 7744 = JCM 18803 = DSM 507]